MKVNMEYKIENRKILLKDDDQGVKQYSSIARLLHNSSSDNLFVVSVNEIKVLPSKNGEISTRMLQKIVENHELLIKFIDLFEWDGNFTIYSNQESKLDAFIWVMKNWSDDWSVSPFSDSFYSSKNIGWGHKPEGSLRVSDHWNFNTRYERENGISNGQHCPTSEPFEGWAVCRFENGMYHLVEKF